MRHSRHQPPCEDRPASEPHGTTCGSVVSERNRYFTGKYMVARDFRLEQEYFLTRHLLHNRLFHGWGVVCGLKVEPHPVEACRDRWVVVAPGIALDCCGRELILEKQVYLEVPRSEPDQERTREAPRSQQEDESDQKWARPSPDQAAAQYQSQHPEPTPRPPEPEPVERYLVCLSYAEKLVEEVPVLYDESGCDPKRLEANRIREAACLEVRRLGEDELRRCWPEPDAPYEDEPCVPCRDDCDEPTVEGGCFKANCPCGECVPLALIERTPGQQYIESEHVKLKGRRQIFTPSTHIARINWPHGGEIGLSRLRDHMGGELRVSFDRKLEEADGERTGINEHTFVVQYGGVQEALEFMRYEEEKPPTLEENGCSAVFTIHPDKLSGRRTIAGSVVYVTLKCDFILDCHGNPVDGGFLGARLPSGDGVPGGTFHSWFRVAYDGAAGE
jgi:hypothetical protein